ncbi:MAG: hypothetical protein QME77_13220 [bacterium]|nr:hypothetical protein [bacterium]
MMLRIWLRSALVALIVAVVSLTAAQPAQGAWLPRISRVVLNGSSNAILGQYFSGGLGFELGAGTVITLGMTYTELRGAEPLITLSMTRPISPVWNLTALASIGDLGGDYRVDRLPEITLSRSGPLAGAALTYGLEAGVGYFVVRPGDLSGVRGVVAGRIATPSIRLGSTLTADASAGYRHYAYSAGASHGAWWASAGLSLAPAPRLSTALTYLRQIPSGSSPLLFDAMGEENYARGSASFRVSPIATLTHSQKYSFISRSIEERVYGLSFAAPGGVTLNVSYDDVPRKLTASISISR